MTDRAGNLADSDGTSPREKQIRHALEAVTSSQTFEGAKRLCEFLTYVVEEELSGRGDMIRAKRIAADVYNRPPEEGSEQETLVRVDAGRLRRRLDQYYASEGSEDPIRIVIKSGGYVPTFDERPVEREAEEPPTEKKSSFAVPFKGQVAIAALSVLLVLAAVWALLHRPEVATETEAPGPVAADDSADDSDASLRARRSALFDKSPSALMAQTHIDEARRIVYPPLNRARVRSAAELCELAITLEPTNPGGYACAARARTFLEFLENPAPGSDERLAEALALAEKAVEIAPTNSFAQSALAWVKFVSGERKTAMDLVRRATALDPEEQLTRHFYGMMAVLNGNSDEILAATDAANIRPEEMFYPFTAARAYFHTGRYEDAIQTILTTAEKTGRTSYFMTAILAASYQATGDTARAQELARGLRRDRPEYHKMLRYLYTNREDADDIILRYEAAETASIQTQ